MTEVERPLEVPFDPDSFRNTPVGGQFFDQESLDTYRTVHERKPRHSKHSKAALEAKLDRESRRQAKDAQRNVLYKEAKLRLQAELQQHEDIQSQLHAARASIARRKEYATKVEQEVEEINVSIAQSSSKEAELEKELVKMQAELEQFQARMEAVKEEQEKARTMIEELTNNRDEAKEEARQAREARRQEAEERRLEEARREGMKRGKLEGMYAGWEEGKIQGYREGHVDGAQDQHEEMVNKKWRALKRELPNHKDIDDRIPSPESDYQGEVPERLRALEAPIILPPQPKPKKARNPAPVPATSTDFLDAEAYARQHVVQSSPEDMYQNFPDQAAISRAAYRPAPPPPVPANLVQRQPKSMPMPMPEPTFPASTTLHDSSHSAQPIQEKRRSKVPPPQPIFTPPNDWEQQRPAQLNRSRTVQAFEKRFKKEPRDVTHAPPEMDFGLFAPPLPYPSVTTPLPQSEILQPGRSIPTPAPSILGKDLYSEESSPMDDRRGRRGRDDDKENPEGSKSSFMSRVTSLVRRQPRQDIQQPPTKNGFIDHPLAWQEARSTPNTPANERILSSPTPSPSIRPRDLSRPNSVYHQRDMSHPNDVYHSRDISRPNSVYQPQDISRPNSAYQPQDISRPNSVYQPRDISRPNSVHAPRDLSQPTTPKTPRTPRTPQWPPPSPFHRQSNVLPDNYIPALEGDGGISLPPPHELAGSAMRSAINISSQQPSREPSPVPSQRSFQPRGRSQEPSPTKQRLSQIGHTLKDATSAIVRGMPSKSKIQAEFRGRSRSRSPISRQESPDPIMEARAISRSRDRSRSASPARMGGAFNNAFVAVPEDGLLRPEHIVVGPNVSNPSLVDDTSLKRGRVPHRQDTAQSDISGRNSPISRMSILSMNANALGISRGAEARDKGFVTYPNASATNLSMIEEERGRHSAYNQSPDPHIRSRSREPPLPPPPVDAFALRPVIGDRRFTDETIAVPDYGEMRGGWDPTSRYPPPPPSIRSGAPGSHTPGQAGRGAQSPNNPFPWPNRPQPKGGIQMPSLLGAQSPASTSRGGFAGVGAGGGYHKRAASASALGLPSQDRNFASPHPSARLSMAGSIIGSDTGRPPIAPKPQPPSRRNRSNPINLDEPAPPPDRSWSGEQQQIKGAIPSRSRANSNAPRPEFIGSQPLVTVEERSPYLQPQAGGSTGSLASIHSNRLKFDPTSYQDPAFLIESKLTDQLERAVGAPPPPSDNEKKQPKLVPTKMGKRISKVLKFGGKNK